MKISALTVSVDYSPQLSQSLALWRETLDQIVVVTSPRDEATQRLCGDLGVLSVATDAFYEGGAYFNKAAGMMVGVPFLSWDDWILLIDADVVPPPNWRDLVDAFQPRPGRLYGAWRVDINGRKFLAPPARKGWAGPRIDLMCGFFHLFHVSDPRAPRAHLLDTRWQTAAWYDTEFELRWLDQKDRVPHLVLTHLGPIRRNWCGVGHEKVAQRMMREPMPLHRVGVSTR